jgi:hypothetical protein
MAEIWSEKPFLSNNLLDLASRKREALALELDQPLLDVSAQAHQRVWSTRPSNVKRNTL